MSDQTEQTSDDEAEQSLFEAPPMGEQERMVEAILFASAEPVTVKDRHVTGSLQHHCAYFG